MICLFKGMVQMSLRLELCVLLMEIKVMQIREGLTKLHHNCTYKGVITY